MKSKVNIAIIGAGLSGLSAAYTLVKDDRVAVTLFEARKDVGGRVKSIIIDGHSVDVGGFIIYPWYDTYHRLIRELGLTQYLRKIKDVNIYYQLDPDGPYFAESKLPVANTEKLQFGSQLLAAWLRQWPDFRAPDINYFGDKTINDVLKAGSGSKNVLRCFIDTVNQGYCYSGLDAFRMSFYAPFVYQTLTHGDLRTGHDFGGNNGLFTHAIANAIEKAGGEIRLGTMVQKINNKEIITRGSAEKFDRIIFAQPVDSLYTSIIQAPSFDYTHFYAVVMRLEKPLSVDDTDNWTAVFAAPKNHDEACITSLIRAESMAPGLTPGYLIVNYKVRDARPITKINLEKQLREELRRLFPDSSSATLVEAVPWGKTMPIATFDFVREVRENQGKYGYYFAGDYLGSPSMETALSSGVAAARLLQHDIVQ